MLCTTTANWVSAVVPYLDKNKRCDLLRYSNANSEIGAKELTEKGVEFTYVPQTPISDITMNMVRADFCFDSLNTFLLTQLAEYLAYVLFDLTVYHHSPIFRCKHCMVLISSHHMA